MKVPGSDVMLAVLHCVHSKLTAWCVIKDYAESQRGEKDAIENDFSSRRSLRVWRQLRLLYLMKWNKEGRSKKLGLCCQL